jgi:hypothetical protein
LALCTSNLPDPEIALPTDHFNSILWTGDSGGRAFTGVGFQPDFVWAKNRDDNWGHTLVDSVRGGNEVLSSESNDAEYTDNNNGWIDSFDSDGFTVIAGSSNANWWNESGDDYVAWNWKAGGTAVSNTDGSITSSVSANTTAGFSIVGYTGTGSTATVGHGLSSAPELLIVKNRTTGSTAWQCGSDVLTSWLYYITLSSTAAENTNNQMWDSTAPSSSVFTVEDAGDVNTNTDEYIAYCFHSVEGYSKVGSYTGNGNVDGTFIYTGFKPACLIIKKYSASGDNWYIYDNKRNTYNVTNLYLYPDSISTELSAQLIDFVSNGWKIRKAATGFSESDEDMLYIAFAESPFKYSNAR